MVDETEPPRSPRHRYSIGFLLSLAAVSAIGFTAYSRWHGRHVVQQSHDAEIALPTQVLRKYISYAGPPPITPFYDDDGNVHPNSCGPSIDFSDSKWTEADVRRALPLLTVILRDHDKSHVGLYLTSKMFGNERFMRELRGKLPRYEIYDRPVKIKHWSNPPF